MNGNLLQVQSVIIDAPELTEDEERDRHRLELRVEQAFYQAGAALRELKERKLYRSTHSTFEEYCQDRFGYHRRHSYQLIDAAVVFENLCANGAQKNLDISGARILPTSERQCRPLTQLEPAQQVKAWQQAIELTGGKAPSGRTVKGIVERLKEKPRWQAADFCCIGDVFVLSKLEDSDRKYNGYPCIAVELKQFSVDVDVHDTTLTVKPENLKKVDSPDAYRQLPQILKRIRRLRQVDSLDRSVIRFLEELGRQNYLTEVEDMLLSCLEEHYKKGLPATENWD
ncbi:hypothetical protein H6G17_08580 [Chroococcidiopsis sp. FACHB-1243]|uniref:hypothetical protein n=1 Tax=Chroococcidiopsis sp. [FACHB-1243] TaxID=2692781 RepID=UPI00177D67BB|nr:hypothetical protein [Chroococcidiopsis sp. [FACHB-1243]]MBD2305570.1 hypothetical protein [Chroococcidiopsis sp. [FACHB-1243]]